MRKSEMSQKKESKLKKSVIGALFNDTLKGVRKLFNELMGTKMEKLSRPKFLEFAKKVLNNQKLTDTEIKELFNFYCKKNKKPWTKAKAAKVRIQNITVKECHESLAEKGRHPRLQEEPSFRPQQENR